MINVTDGVNCWDLKIPMAKVWYIYKGLCTELGVKPVMTDGVAPRAGKSLHPVGLAVDLRIRDLESKQQQYLYRMIKLLLGRDYDVILYKTHIHVEYQRHLDDMELWLGASVYSVVE